MSVCVILGSLIGRALSWKDRDAGFESRSWIFATLAPNVGLEPTTLRLRVSCSTNWVSSATNTSWTPRGGSRRGSRGSAEPLKFRTCMCYWQPYACPCTCISYSVKLSILEPPVEIAGSGADTRKQRESMLSPARACELDGLETTALWMANRPQRLFSTSMSDTDSRCYLVSTRCLSRWKRASLKVCIPGDVCAWRALRVL